MEPTEIKRAVAVFGMPVPAVAKLLGISPWTLRDYMRTGQFCRQPPVDFRARLVAAMERQSEALRAAAEEFRDAP